MTVGKLSGYDRTGCVHAAMNPKILEEGNLYNFSNFGTAGMFVTIICGLFIVMIFRLSNRLNLASEDSPLPDFCKEWFNSIIPIFVILLISTIAVYNFEFDLFNFIVLLCNPILGIVDTYWGRLADRMSANGCIPSVSAAGCSMVRYGRLQQRHSLQTQQHLQRYHCPMYTAMVLIMHISSLRMGVTLPLVYFLRSKSKRLKLLGKVYIGPTLLNINEPIMYGNVV